MNVCFESNNGDTYTIQHDVFSIQPIEDIIKEIENVFCTNDKTFAV